MRYSDTHGTTRCRTITPYNDGENDAHEPGLDANGKVLSHVTNHPAHASKCYDEYVEDDFPQLLAFKVNHAYVCGESVRKKGFE